MPQPRKLLAALVAGVLPLTALISVGSAGVSQAAPQACAGVWVVVQPDGSDPASATTTCVTSPGSSVLDTLGSVYTVVEAFSSPSQIDGAPADPNFTTNGGFYWAYCQAPVADALTWSFASDGAANVAPQADVVSGFVLTNDFSACPGVTALPQAEEPTGSPTPTETTASPTPTTTPSEAPSATPTPSGSGAEVAVAQAADFIVDNLPGEDDGVGAVVDAAMGLTATAQCRYADTITDLVSTLEGSAADYVGTDPGRAAKLSILVSAVGLDPADFGGLDLVEVIGAGTAGNGEVGSFPSAFTQSLALIALSRAGADVPTTMVEALLSFQGDQGGFGFEWDGTFTTDPDSTALAIQALVAVGGQDAAIDEALDWADQAQTGAGYWENYSPVDSTGLMASAIVLADGNADQAISWLAGQQLADGGFPSSLGGTTSNLMATVSALYAGTGTSLVTAELDLAECGNTPTPSQSADAGDGEELADTGASDLSLPLGIGGIALVMLGGVLIVLRRGRQYV